jgi:signal peptidase I
MCVIPIGVVFFVSGFALVALTLLYRSYSIPSDGMAPAVKSGDHVLARKISGSGAHRGDIVIFRNADRSSPFGALMKRVIALGGDRIDEVDGKVRVNGQALRESYLAPGTVTNGVQATVIPAGAAYVMGDNRPQSSDSRASGPIAVGLITARVDYSGLPVKTIVLVIALLSGAILVVLFVSNEMRRRRMRAAQELSSQR